METSGTALDISLRLARPGDATTIARMSESLIEAGLPWSWTPGRVALHIRAHDSVVLTALIGTELAGFAIMQFSDETAHLNLLAVRPDCEGLGIGRRLVEWLEKAAVTAGISKIALEVRAANVGARWFYRKLGYREIRCVAGYYCHVENAVQMARDLRVFVENNDGT